MKSSFVLAAILAVGAAAVVVKQQALTPQRYQRAIEGRVQHHRSTIAARLATQAGLSADPIVPNLDLFDFQCVVVGEAYSFLRRGVVVGGYRGAARRCSPEYSLSLLRTCCITALLV